MSELELSNCRTLSKVCAETEKPLFNSLNLRGLGARIFGLIFISARNSLRKFCLSLEILIACPAFPGKIIEINDLLDAV